MLDEDEDEDDDEVDEEDEEYDLDEDDAQLEKLKPTMSVTVAKLEHAPFDEDEDLAE